MLREQAANSGVDITEIYMIGDNPKGDIVGSNRMGAGWNSILVQTGIYKPTNRELLRGDEVPTFEVKNMEEAVRTILEKERLSEFVRL